MPSPDLSSVEHGIAQLDGARIHYVSQGEGPLVLMVHGFPESWYSWRHQIPALAAAGYRAVAIDVRGYGRSSAPTAIEDYSMLRLVGDNVQLVRALGAETATVVGHDWGAPIAWHSALLRPDVFTAVAALSVPWTPRSKELPTTRFAEMGGDGQFYIDYFQEPGVAEAEIEADLAHWLLGFYHSASGEGAPVAPGMGARKWDGLLRDGFAWPDEGTMPGWLDAADLAFYVGEFERSGLTGGLNRYRCVDRDWHDLAGFGSVIDVPALFIGGTLDGPTIWSAHWIERFSETLPQLWKSEILDGCGHWTQQERPDEVNELLLGFLASR